MSGSSCDTSEHMEHPGNILAAPSTAPTAALQVLWYPGLPQKPLKAQCARAQIHLSHP